MSNLFNSVPSIIHHVEHAQIIDIAKFQQSYNQEEPVTHLNNALNYKHKDGRIYASKSIDENYTAVTVSPFHPKFDSQIEDGIKDLVYAFVEKNYIVMSSCQGHDDLLGFAFIKIAFPNIEDREYIIEQLKHIRYISFLKSDKSANVELYVKNNSVKFKKLDAEGYSYKEEADAINKLYFRNHNRYYFLNIEFFKYSGAWWNIIGKYVHKNKRLKTFKHTQQELASLVKSDHIKFSQN
jgi:hypothetical protein